MTIYETASLVVAALGVGSLWFGIWQMRRSGDQRAAREDTRHAEAMHALDARHAESMHALDARHAEAMRALEALIRGMESVIERTGGRA